jgi:hypothetical protein
VPDQEFKLNVAMRPRVVVVTFLLAAVIFGLAELVSHRFRPQPATGGTPVSASNPAAPQAASNLTTATADSAPPAPLTPPRTANIIPTVPAPPVVPETNQDEYVQDRVAQLMALAMNDDVESLNIICSELANPDKEIRAGALAAVVQFGDRSVAPRLRELAAQTGDPLEKIDILAAADQLDLPPLGSPPSSQPTMVSQ